MPQHSPCRCELRGGGDGFDARLDAAARFEAAAAALRRGEGLPGLLPPAPTGPGVFQHQPLNTTSLPPRWRVPGGLDRSSGGCVCFLFLLLFL